MNPPVADVVARLAVGGSRLATMSAPDRAALARRTARAVAAAADPWARVAVDIKQAPGDDVAAAEEIATGPLCTLRLALLHARAWLDIARHGMPRAHGRPRLLHPERAGGGPRAALVSLDVLPASGPSGSLHDGTIYSGLEASVRCHDPGGLEAFTRSWLREAQVRPRGGGVAVVLGAGNVTGLGPADVLCQVFEHGRAALLKLHPVQAPLREVLDEALRPLVDEGLVGVVDGGPELAREAISTPAVSHVHLTGGRAAFDALVWGQKRGDAPVLAAPITCELGNVTPWFVLPGRYPARVLAFQADLVAASIANNTSFNCLATKVIVTSRSWEQRDTFLERVRRRLEGLPARPGWYPGSRAHWEEAAGRAAPADGTLPYVLVAGGDACRERRLWEREWFVPVACEAILDGEDMAGFCRAALAFSHRLPGSLCASVTRPPTLSERDRRHADDFLDHLAFGVVAVDTWSALAYATGIVPWGGFPGGTLAEPRSGIGFVHDPLLLPLVHNSIVRGPAWSPLRPAWVPWHRAAGGLARGLVGLYDRRAAGKAGWPALLRMLPAVLRG